MTAVDWAGILLMAGVGGVLGAASAVLLAGARAQGSYASFKSAFQTYLSDRTDPASQELGMRFQEADGALSGLMSAVEKLKRALRLR